MSFCVCYSNIYVLCKYQSETIRNQVIGYLTFYISYLKFEKNDQLTGYLVKVHSTNQYLCIFVSTYMKCPVIRHMINIHCSKD